MSRFSRPLYSHNILEESIIRAHERNKASCQAIVHGDIHLMNILAPNSGEAYLIDYALSGPGHPAYDLVRLECSLYFRFLRCMDTESSFACFQRAITLDNADEASLRASFPSWWSSRLNESLLRGALLARDTAKSVLNAHDLGHADYVAVKFIISCWSISIPMLQMGLVRATMSALACAV